MRRAAQSFVANSIASAIQNRYDALASQDTSLSCGSAASRVEARPGDLCVDLGCGRGKDVLTLAKKVGPRGHVFGIDGSLEMLTTARQRAEDEGLINVTFWRASLEELPLGDDAVDWVVSNCALNHAQDKARVWREIARVLAPGGRFVVSDIYAVEPIAPQWRNDPTAIAECWAGAELRADSLAHVTAAGLLEVQVSDERKPYQRGHALLASFTLSGRKPNVKEVKE